VTFDFASEIPERDSSVSAANWPWSAHFTQELRHFMRVVIWR
jgi:hypothetical protein